MAGIDDYKRRLNENTNEIYDNAKNQEYTTLLKKEVALENSKANALKYTNNQINAMGMGGTGYGSSLGAGIYGRYLDKAQNIEGTYNTNVNNIEAERRQKLFENENKVEQRDNDIFAGILADMETEGATQKGIDDYLKNLGYGDYGDDGAFVFGKKPEGMSEANWQSLQYRYGIRSKELTEEAENQVSSYSVDNYQDAIGLFKSADGGELGSLKDEVKYLLGDEIKNKVSFSDGDIVKLSANPDSSGDEDSTYLVYRNGKWSQCSKADYLNSDNRYWIRSNKNSRTEFTIDKNGVKVSDNYSEKRANAREIEANININKNVRNPFKGQTYKYLGNTYVYNGKKWELKN